MTNDIFATFQLPRTVWSCFRGLWPRAKTFSRVEVRLKRYSRYARARSGLASAVSWIRTFLLAVALSWNWQKETFRKSKNGTSVCIHHSSLTKSKSKWLHWQTPCLGRDSVSQSVMSSRMLPAWPQLQMQSSSWLYCVGGAPESILLSLDRTPQLGWEKQDKEGRLDKTKSVRRESWDTKVNIGRRREQRGCSSPECWNCSWRHKWGQLYKRNSWSLILKW